MDFKSAFEVKNAIASTFLKSKKETGIVVALAAASSKSATVRSRVEKDVKGVGIGEKTSGENYVKVLTKKRSALTRADVSRYFGLDINDVHIQPTGPIRFKMPTNNHRPPFPGISVSHFSVTAGTLGCFVKDNNKKVYILSNNHVLANTNRAKPRDIILQPGKLDGGRKRKDSIAELSRFIKLEFTQPNSMDAAIAEVLDDISPIFKINQVNKIAGTINPQNGMRVEKFGRTTGHTKGRITVRNLDLKVEFDGIDIDFEDQFEIKGNNGTMFCDGGDSGSLIFERDTLKAVGLLFAGDDTGTTFATPIKEVLKAFSVKIL